MSIKLRTLLVLLFLVCGSKVWADCDLLLQHGITNITRYKSADHAIAYKWHRYCGLDYSSVSDSKVSSASVSVFGYGSGDSGYNSNQQRNKLTSWCDQNSDFAKSNSSLAVEAEVLSTAALSTYQQCKAMSRKQINIKFLPSGEHDQFIHFEIDSTHDGSLKYLGLKTKNYKCEESMVKTESGSSVDIASQPEINNANIQIDCERTSPKNSEKDGVGEIKYDSGYISVNTSGPSFSMAFPEVVSNYFVTPPSSVLAFNSSRCPNGWVPYKPSFGRFIRGIDLDNTGVDPSGLRSPGSLQADSIKQHSHSYRSPENPPRTDNRGGRAGNDRFSALRTDSVQRKNQTTGNHGSSETVPKNVALLYCEKVI